MIRFFLLVQYGPALAGGVLWTIGVLVARPDPFETVWARAVLLLAALVLVPLGLRLASLPADSRWLTAGGRAATILRLPAALLLGAAQLLPSNLLAAALTIPWLVTTGLVALAGAARLWRQRFGPLHEICTGAGLLYLAVGGAWTMLDRLGMRPLDFDPVIVLLTAIHFHYAGFLLPLLTGLAMRELGGRTATLAGAGVIAGVPLVAIGITTTQVGFDPGLECLAASSLAGAGLLTAWLHLRLATNHGRPIRIRLLWAAAAVSLAASMVLAGMYGSRFYLSITALDIPWMRALHGTANALGFGLLGLLGWTSLRADEVHRAPGSVS